MKAIRFDRFGDPDVLYVADIPEPARSGEEVVVEVRAAAINPSDLKNVQGRMPQTVPPRTPGRDFAGVVVEGPEELIGKEVFGTGGEIGFTQDGSHAERLIVPQGALCEKPGRLSFSQAACIGVPFVTAALMLERAQTAAGDAIAVAGARGAVGNAAVQIAERHGAKVIRVERAPDGEPQPLTVYAEQGHIAEQVRDLTGGNGVTVWLDTVGGASLDAGIHSLKRSGRLVTITAGKEQRVELDIFRLYRQELWLSGVDSLRVGADKCGDILRNLLPGFQDGSYTISEDIESLPLERGIEGYRSMFERGREGLTVITPVA